MFYLDGDSNYGKSALDLLLGADVTVMATLSLAAVSSLCGKSSVAFSADHLLAFVFSGESGESSFDLDGTETTTSKSEDEMEGRLFLDVVVLESYAILKLLSGEDESLLIWGDSFLVLDLGLDVLDGVCWLNIKGDGLSCQGFDEDLHTTSESEDEMKS